VNNIGTNEDILRSTVPEIQRRHQGVLAHSVVGTEDEFTATEQRIRKVVLESEFDTTLMQDVLEGQFHVVRESGAVADVVEVLLRLGLITLSAFDDGLSIGQQDLGVADVRPRIGRVLLRLCRIEELGDTETGIVPVSCIVIIHQMEA